MFLKTLELQGFKSFPDKTKLSFEDGTTIIVGPNGSGKSNISDAMRWVLGEISAKSIRGSKMEDIIFGGADTRRPMGYAEVSVTFDNTDEENRLDSPYNEVTVTRRYYRSGDSEYFINKSAVRLKDIYELFMNTGIGRDGYSIIGQGKIDEMISKKSEERRSVFEDAAGIAKYRHKKVETERKLFATDENMTRVNDIFTEVEAQVLPLEKEAQKAKKALDLLEAKKCADVRLWLYDTDKLRSDIATAEDEYMRSSFDLQSVEEILADLERQNDHLFGASTSNKQASEQLLSLIKEQTTVNYSLESEHRVTETNIKHSGELVCSAEGIITTIEKTIANEQLNKDSHLCKITEYENTYLSLQEHHKTLTEEHKTTVEQGHSLDFRSVATLADIKKLEADAVDIKVRISVLENSLNTDTRKYSSIHSEIENYKRVSEKLRTDYENCSKTIADYEKSAEKYRDDALLVESQLETKYAEKAESSKELAKKKLSCESISQRIENFKNMEEHFEGYNNSVRFIMKKYAQGEVTDEYGVRCAKIYGPLSRIISVDNKYLTAIETALGANLQNIVVEDESVAKAAMYTLKKAEAGRATFFPLSSMRPSTLTHELSRAAEFEGFVAYGDKLVTSEGRFDNIISNLLGRTVIFDKIDNAINMAKALKFSVRAVTLDGQQLNVGGSFTGGSIKQKGGILGRAGEIESLSSQLKTIKNQLQADEKVLSSLNADIQKAEQAKYSAQDKLKLITTMQNSENTRLEQFRAKIEANETLIQKLSSDYSQIDTQRQHNEESITSMYAEQKQLCEQIKELTDMRNKLDVKHNELLTNAEEQSSSITSVAMQINDIRKDIETEKTLCQSAQKHIEECLLDVDVQKEKINTLREQINIYEQKQVANRQNFSEGCAVLEHLNSQRAKLEEGSLEFERKLSIITQKTREKAAQKETLFRAFTKFENRLNQLRGEQDKLSGKLFDEYELTRSAAVALGYPPVTAECRGEVAAKLTECKNKLRTVGNVDLDAIEKYREVKTRYDSMRVQIEDLNRAKSELCSIISSLERDMKTAFIDSFNKINENFNRVFGELFGGGSAELSLSEPDDILGSGIEIKAAPPGKIIKNLMQLSGGEQSFIAIALFFAILQVNPTPFCILDEIEAALDEVNVVRFAEYIKRYSCETQFIIITHRRGTMEAADRLYGVTMPERGISKVLVLSIADISKEKGEDWNGILR